MPDKFNKFKTAWIDGRGGKITFYGVSVEFPPGALAKPEKITVSILSEAAYLPDITAESDTALVTPVVSCEPHGLQLAKPMEMVPPHCAGATDDSHVQEAWEFTTLTSNTRPGEAVNWHQASNTDMTIDQINDSDIYSPQMAPFQHRQRKSQTEERTTSI